MHGKMKKLKGEFEKCIELNENENKSYDVEREIYRLDVSIRK